MQVSTLGMLAWPVSAQVGPNSGLLSLPIFSFSSSLRHKYLSQVFLVRQARLDLSYRHAWLDWPGPMRLE